MLALTFCILLLLTNANYFLGRSFFYPAFVYCAAWTLALFCLLVSGNTFYDVSADTLEIFMWGAIAFSVGCAAAKFFPLSLGSSVKQVEPKKIVNVLVVFLVIALPFYILWIIKVIADRPGDFFLAAVHDSFVEMMDAGPDKFTPSYIFFINLLGFTPMVAMLAWTERKDRLKRAVLAVLIAMAYHLFTGSRLTVLRLLVSILAIEWFTTNRLRFKQLAIAVGIGLTIFTSIALVLRVSSDEMGMSEKAAVAVNQFIIYTASPLVGFDRVVRDPRVVPHNTSAATFFIETAGKLGMKVDVPPRQSEFVNTGPDNRGNVFTIYFAYLGTGMPLGYLLIALEAFLVTLVYRSAVAGNKISIIMAAYLFPYVALSTFTDLLLLDLNVTLKTLFVCWFFYSFPAAKARFAKFLSAAAKEPPLLSHHDSH